MLPGPVGSTPLRLEGHGPYFGRVYVLLVREGHAFGTLSLAFLLYNPTMWPGLSRCVPVAGEMRVFLPDKQGPSSSAGLSLAGVPRHRRC